MVLQVRKQASLPSEFQPVCRVLPRTGLQDGSPHYLCPRA